MNWYKSNNEGNLNDTIMQKHLAKQAMRGLGGYPPGIRLYIRYILWCHSPVLEKKLLMGAVKGRKAVLVH